MRSFLLALLLGFAVTAIAAAPPPAQPLTVPDFVEKMVTVHQFDRNEIIHLFQQTAYVPEVIDRINQPFEEKPWDFYKNFFITSDRVQAGVTYWHEHEATLNKAAKDYGVPPELIVAIIGMETKYGEETGKFPELGTLSTLSFRYPKRALFFQSELEHYLLLTRQYHLDPLKLQGSYAGALGIPQFMPSNYRVYAVSYDGNIQVNLLENHDDAIASIANFLHRSGWKANQPVAVPAISPTPIKAWLISGNSKTNYRLKTLNKFGITTTASIAPQQKAALIAMHNTHDQEYWITFSNFNAIMAYNPRTTYALATYLFSQALLHAYEDGINTASSAATPAR